MNPSARPSSTRLRGLDGVRAIAAFSIVGLHAASFTGATQATGWGKYFARLDAGVAVFFVLSAFLLYRPFVAAHLGARRPVNLRTFWWRRAVRIYPAYWVALTVVIVAFGHSDLHGWGEYVRNYLLVQIYQPGYGLGGIVPAWTLAVEVSFYAALPLYAWVLRSATQRLPADRRIRVELAAAAALYAIALVVRVVIARANGTDAVSLHWLPAMSDWFALGIALAVLREASATAGWAHAARRTVAAHTGFVLVLCAFAFVVVCNIGLPTNLTSGSVGEDLARQVLFGVVAVALVAPFALAEDASSRATRVLDSRVAVAIGTISYGVFLWHYDWILQLQTWGAFDWVPSLRLASVFMMASALALATAAVSWRFLERPLLRRAARTVPETDPSTHAAP